LEEHPLLVKRVNLLKSIRAVGEVTALTWALEVGNPHRFSSIGKAESYCGLTSALNESADKQQRGPISKQRNPHLQTVLIEAAKLAPRWNAQLAAVTRSFPPFQTHQKSGPFPPPALPGFLGTSDPFRRPDGPPPLLTTFADRSPRNPKKL